MIKKISILLTLLILATSLSACKQEEKIPTLNVYNWGEYISDGSEDSVNVNEEFENYYFEKYGKKIKVNYTTYASNEDMYNKLKSGGVNYDIVVPSEYMIDKMRREGMLLKLDFSNIPNYENIEDSLKHAFYDPNCEYTVPYLTGYVGIIYNTSLVDDEITDWDCLWNEKYKGEILQFNNPRDAFGTAMYGLGIDANTKDKSKWIEAAEAMKKQKPLVQSYVMDEIFNKMKNGSAAIAPYYAGDFLTMYEDNEDLAFCYPKSQTNIFVDAMCIPSCSKQKEIAEEYINFIVSDEISIVNAEYTGYTSPNKHVKEDPEYIESMQEIHEDAMEIIYPGDSINTDYFETLDFETNELQNELWEELKIDNAVEPWVYIFSGLIVLMLFAYIIFKKVNKIRNARYY